MRKRLIIGFGLIIVIFSVAAVFILNNLNTIISSEALMARQWRILTRYNAMLYTMRSAQSELYRHQAGYSRDIDSLVEYVLQFEDMLAQNKKECGGRTDRVECNRCHSAKGKLETMRGMLDQTYQYLDKYKEKISLIVTLKDVKLSTALEKEAALYGDEIVTRITAIRHALSNMNEQMKEEEVASVSCSRYYIVLAIVLSIVLSLVTVIVMIRSITGPVTMLVSGIERVSSGDYSSKVEVASDDEIGFLAKSFNEMTDNLNKMTRQKDMLMQELQELNNSLEERVSEATEELRAAHEKILRSETLSAVGTFASGVAHELATPLSSVISYFQMVKGKGMVPDELREDCGLIEGELLRCRSILNSMLNFARLPEGEKVASNVNAIIAELLKLIGYQKEYRNISLDFLPAPGLPDIVVVPGQLRQVFINILINGLQAMGREGRGTLTIRTMLDEEGSRIAIEVTDTGPGIPEGDSNKIFQPFYTSKASGTGLGLSISYGIIKGHGGDIEVESAPGRGTTFRIYLPAGAESTRGRNAPVISEGERPKERGEGELS